jgi:putative ATP-dependent endonuclease of OLD family
MKLISVSLESFRCYGDEVSVVIDDLTAFIGKNDIGKSTILEAMEAFFNGDLVEVGLDDLNVFGGQDSMSITCEFADLPDSLTLDAGAITSLKNEYLLTERGTLKIKKKYDCRAKSVSAEVFAIAWHPTAPSVSGLLELKEKELQSRIRELGIDAPLKGNPGMRKALWATEAELMLREVAVPLSKGKEDTKRIWEQIEQHLPIFALFQSDRSSRDSDGEVQTPMKAAVSAAIAEVQPEILAIQAKVREKAEEIARSTFQVLRSLDPNLAKELVPQFSVPTNSKWTGLFSVSMDTEDGIPLNKRGSGVRRLVLVSFFKAAAERRMSASASRRSIIYAVEEPETGQHPNNQRILIEAFKSLSAEDGLQVMLTTHSPGFASELPSTGIRFITRTEAGQPCVQSGVDVFGVVAQALGIVADSRVKVLVCVEGPLDVVALRHLSAAIHASDPRALSLGADERVAFVVLGGSTLKHWVSEHYLKSLGKPEVHIYDNDVAPYAEQVAAVNGRADGSWATLTRKYEIENYLHSDAVYDAFGVRITVGDGLDAAGRGVPKNFAIELSKQMGYDGIMGDDKAKFKLAQRAFPLMTAERLLDRDPDGEVRGWLDRIAAML